MKKLFGTDGMRGHAGDFPLDEQTIRIAGGSLARHLKGKNGNAPRFVTGRDTRESGEWIERAFAEGAAANGAKCESAGVITTPGIAFLTGKFEFDAGIVISASHNPYQDNGIKIFLPSGKKLDEETERLIENDIFERKEFEVQDSRSEVQDLNADKFQREYVDHLKSEFVELNLENFKIVLDCANGAASSLAPPLFKSFGAEVVTINHQPNGTNINENCGSLHLENLRRQVLAEKADFGAAFDGDADRALFIDEKGAIADGDATLWVMANFLDSKNKLAEHSVVATVMSNIGLEIALASKNIKLVRTAVGDKYVLEELLKSGASVGGEQSGHIIFPGESLVGDGMKTTLALLEAVRAQNKSLSGAVSGFRQYPQILINIKVREKQPFEQVPAIAEAVAQVENELGGKGRLLLRYSGTENLARVMIEGADQTEIESQAQRLVEIIRQNLG